MGIKVGDYVKSLRDKYNYSYFSGTREVINVEDRGNGDYRVFLKNYKDDYGTNWEHGDYLEVVVTKEDIERERNTKVDFYEEIKSLEDKLEVAHDKKKELQNAIIRINIDKAENNANIKRIEKAIEALKGVN